MINDNTKYKYTIWYDLIKKTFVKMLTIKIRNKWKHNVFFFLLKQNKYINFQDNHSDGTFYVALNSSTLIKTIFDFEKSILFFQNF